MELDRYSSFDLVRELIRRIAPDPPDEVLKNTPLRVVDSWGELFGGYYEDPRTILKTFDNPGYDEMIVQKGIPFQSFCEHHLLPFSGVAAVGYLPGSEIVGLSKLARLVRAFSRRLQVQERMTVEIAKTFQEVVQPRGVGCVVAARHSCVSCRGVRVAGSVTVTSHLTGVFRTDPAARSEFLKFVGEV